VIGVRRGPIILLTLAAAFAFTAQPGAGAGLDHSDYDAFLKKHVRNGLVDYGAIKRDSSRLTAYLRRLEVIDPKDFESWERDAKIALWINAYNAITIYGIVLNYPIEYGGFLARARFPKSSIRQIADFWDTVFVKVMGLEITLDHIEHEILRKEFDDPRIHFSLVCASLGCPLLSNHAYDVESLQARLERDVGRFVNNEDKVRLDTVENKIYLSSVFDWYSEDFGAEAPPRWLERYPKSYRGVMNTVAQYTHEDERDYIINQAPRLEFLHYDWSLNELSPSTQGQDSPR
jgi:hypothetical protein